MQGPFSPPAGPARTLRTAVITRNMILVLVVSSLGNVLEWFDFAVFGFFAPVFSPLFFPGGDGTDSLAKTFGVFGAAFVCRPLGGIFFGYIGACTSLGPGCADYRPLGGQSRGLHVSLERPTER
jgi:hypothetical protein